MWLSVPVYSAFLGFKYSSLFYVCCIGLMVYSILFSGISRHNKFGVLGSVRGISQSVSYEVVYVLLIIGVVFLGGSLSFGFLNSFSFMLFFFVVFFVCILAEANRSPFDFAEGERELVRGFNTEFCRVGFVFLFLAEYGAVLMMSVLFSVLFFGNS